MPNELKQFGAKDTSSFNKRFQTSVWKLTFSYALILFVILFLSSSILYSAFSKRIEHRYRDFPPLGELPIQNPRPVSPTQEELQEDLIVSLVFVNGILLFGAVILSYWLAQITLKPLKVTFENQRRFFADASHELRTPLSILKIDLENRLNSPNLRPLEIESIKSNLEEVDRMSKLVGDLLVLSRLNEAESVKESHKRDIELNAFIKDLSDRLLPISKEHLVEIKFEPSQKNINIHADEELLSKSLTNVIKNAILYNKPNGEVFITTKVDEKNIYINVKDSGVGIPQQELEKVFERFYRVDKSRSRLTGGSGLGLSIVESSVKNLGGQISLESAPGEGTVVTVKFPRKYLS